LLTSILLRPTLPLGRFAVFSLLIGDALAAVLEDHYQLDPAVKWPNDVLLDGRKVSGVLINTRRVPGDGPFVAVVGIGVNVNSTRESLPVGSTSLGAETGSVVDLEAVRQALFDEIDLRYGALVSDNIDLFVNRLNERLWLRGEQVSIDDAGRRITGRLLGVERDGSLLLQTAHGPRRIVSGEMTRGPRAIG
jgi:BirA family biotin operon repressor/biotin-[acetyl-CoA-carboxylase] ligase